jgi:prepilin-type processing-associated H-X9-DG protein
MLTVPQPQKVVLYLDQSGGYANIFFDTYERFSRRHTTSSDRQRMQLNAAFVDGHVEPIDMSYNTNPRSPWRSTFDAAW